MSAETLLSRLDKVRKLGPDRWMACCPSHQDSRPSLSIRELPDGRVLVHCWTGCEVENILGSVGLTFDNLFPEKLEPMVPHRQRSPFSPREVLIALEPEIMAIGLLGRDMLNGKHDERAQKVLISSVAKVVAAKAYVEGL